MIRRMSTRLNQILTELTGIAESLKGQMNELDQLLLQAPEGNENFARQRFFEAHLALFWDAAKGNWLNAQKSSEFEKQVRQDPEVKAWEDWGERHKTQLELICSLARQCETLTDTLLFFDQPASGYFARFTDGKLVSNPSMVERLLLAIRNLRESRSGQRKVAKGHSPELQRVLDLVCSVAKDSTKSTQKELCAVLDSRQVPLPPGATWKVLKTWQAAFAKKRRAVSRWINGALEKSRNERQSSRRAFSRRVPIRS